MSRPGPYRLDAGGSIDRSRPLRFFFNGRALSGFEGDTVASALLANGVRTIARSFKYHRPRGVFASGVEEPNALVSLHSGSHAIPTERATLCELSEGLEVQAQSGWPSLGFDLLRAIDFAKPLVAAGFYNKTFMWPRWSWYEGTIRRMAGFGRASLEPDPQRYQTQNIHCDVLVVGGGAAGLQAALSAATAGARVLLVERDSVLGGQRRWDGGSIEGKDGARWIEEAVAQLARHPDVRILTRTSATSYHDHNVLALCERVGSQTRPGVHERYWIVRTRQTILATGAIEQPLIFDNNDRPGVMLAGAARKYLRCHGIAPGRRIVLATNNMSAYETLLDLHESGVEVVAVLDSQPDIPQPIARQLEQWQIPLYRRSMPLDTRGFGGLRQVVAGRLTDDAGGVGETWKIAADALLVSGGWSPTLHLCAQAGGKLRYHEASGALELETMPRDFRITGAAAGVQGGFGHEIGPRISPAGNSNRQWVDLRHDVLVSDLELAQRENFTSIEHVKRHTTVGMSADQGKTSNAAALQVIGRIRGLQPAELGHTTFRPPFVPVTLGAIAGRDVGELFAPARQTPLHAWHVSHGGVLENYGEWQRPAAYPRAGEQRHDAIRREARAVRNGVGLFDQSSLGKIEIHGPDAVEFLDRFYINNLRTLQPGKTRYGIMLRESGVIFDDGTIVALAPDRLLITTTSGNALRVGAWLEEWHQCEWPELRVTITPVTDQWATMALTGAQARSVLYGLRPDLDISNEAFPHLAMRESRLLGHPARIYRVSFSGELTYEINVPAGAGQELWEALLHEGRAHGIAPYGLEALLLMRLEKGFLHIGSDTDGTTVPDDVGWGTPAANKKTHYIGKRSLTLPHHQRSDRLQLIGLAGLDGKALPIGSHLRLTGTATGKTSDGWITSTGAGVLDEKPIALAMLRAGRAQLGQEVAVFDQGNLVTRATVVNPPFFDPAGARMHG
ncbi:MAG TPA: 2Fe-2S iron-sulfur cluster-binding protein [Steroidobacteraceae bacterium]|nr:2Fe-2S iron-sulfur cluster-binding protein [Steroidobacteraceae bacterium]